MVWRVGAVCAVGALCALTLRRYVPELALLLAVTAAGAVLLLLSGTLFEVAETLRALEAQAGLGEELTGPVYRVLIIALLTRLTSQICRDAGEGTIAVCSEMAGAFCALVATLPLLRRVLELIGGLLS